MPRKRRFYLSGVPCHVIQRGHDRKACFSSPDDCRYYLERLREACGAHAVKVHAWVLMTNHVHLLVTPEDTGGVSRVLQAVGRRYVRFVNQRDGRSGTLWEGRHKASLVDSDRYLMVCYRYIELNPVRAGMVPHPGDYPWSSYHANALGVDDRLSQPHEVYLGLGATEDGRRQVYRELLREGVDGADLDAMRAAAQRCLPVGNEAFKDEVSQRLGVPVSYRPRGRPAGPTRRDDPLVPASPAS